MTGDPPRRVYTVVATPADAEDAWNITIADLPHSWTVAFSADEIEEHARARIALDTGTEPDEFDVNVLRVILPTRS
jgi:predicted RNase H-like HicB family nuclease